MMVAPWNRQLKVDNQSSKTVYRISTLVTSLSYLLMQRCPRAKAS